MLLCQFTLSKSPMVFLKRHFQLSWPKTTRTSISRKTLKIIFALEGRYLGNKGQNYRGHNTIPTSKLSLHFSRFEKLLIQINSMAKNISYEWRVEDSVGEEQGKWKEEDKVE